MTCCVVIVGAIAIAVVGVDDDDDDDDDDGYDDDHDSDDHHSDDHYDFSQKEVGDMFVWSSVVSHNFQLSVPLTGYAVGAVRSPEAAAVLQHNLRSRCEAAEAAKPVTEQGSING